MDLSYAADSGRMAAQKIRLRRRLELVPKETTMLSSLDTHDGVFRKTKSLFRKTILLLDCWAQSNFAYRVYPTNMGAINCVLLQ